MEASFPAYVYPSPACVYPSPAYVWQLFLIFAGLVPKEEEMRPTSAEERRRRYAESKREAEEKIRMPMLSAQVDGVQIGS